VLKMQYIITFTNDDGKSFSVSTNEESTMYEVWVMVSYAYPHAFVFDQELDDVLLTK
jgi:hypothetical protein